MTSIYGKLAHVVNQVAGVSNPLARHMLVLAAREFLRETHAWQEDLTVDAVEDQDEYTLTHEYDADILQVASVTVSDSARDQDEYSFDGVDTITLDTAPIEDETDGIEATVVLVPVDGEDQIPDRIYTRYSEAIASGAMAYLFALPRRAWSDPKYVEYHSAIFRRGIASAKIARDTGNKVGTPQRIVLPTFL